MSHRDLVGASAFCVVAAATLVAAAQFPRIEIPDWENSVRFELLASQEPVRPGDAFELALVAEIDPGYHLYGPEETKPSRTEVEVRGEHLEASEAVFPPVITRDLEGLGEYDLYEGRIAIRVPVTLSKAASSEEAAFVKVNYQVCTDFACSAPTSRELEMGLPVAKPGTPVKDLHRDIFQSTK